MLTYLISDPHSPEPFRLNRQPPNGRQRSLRRPTLHSPIRNLPPPLRKSLLRLHIRRRRLRRSSPPPHPQPNVSIRRNSSRPLRSRQLQPAPQALDFHVFGRSFLRYIDISPLRQRPGLLLLAARTDCVDWYHDSHGYFVRIPSYHCGGGLVHVQQFWHVLFRGKDEWDEGVGCLSAGVVLCCFWHYGDFFVEGDGVACC